MGQRHDWQRGLRAAVAKPFLPTSTLESYEKFGKLFNLKPYPLLRVTLATISPGRSICNNTSDHDPKFQVIWTKSEKTAPLRRA